MIGDYETFIQDAMVNKLSLLTNYTTEEILKNWNEPIQSVGISKEIVESVTREIIEELAPGNDEPIKQIVGSESSSLGEIFERLGDWLRGKSGKSN